MKTHKREILIYYNPTLNADRKTIAYAKSVSPYIKSYAFSKAPSSTTSWQQILKRINLNPKELLNKAHPYYQEHIRGREFDDESWIKILRKNPDLFKGPIAVRGKHVILCKSPKDIYKLSNVS
ncbi:MAG: glutaredoxin [Bacteroidetes bacterium]|nr:glutaredoxin [Bacteroidota bacterium]